LLALGLTTLRFALGPFVALVAILGLPGRIIAICIVVAGLSDVYDGKTARRFGVATPGLRRYDSVADTVFYIGVAAALWIIHPSIVRDHAILLIAFAIMQVGGHAVDVVKFGRDTSYHTWTGRAFGLSLFVAGPIVFWTGNAGSWLVIALIVGLVAHVDALVITMILPSWHHDVHTIANALRIRRRTSP
jgi:CDP-diacylglycerol--glycerol-3-phosphate 3-phosphatidyltransferase